MRTVLSAFLVTLAPEGHVGRPDAILVTFT
jgi:hypothetical protein